jgi:nitrogen fixation protein FixH
MQQKFLVGTGIAPLFHIYANSPEEAIEALKQQIRDRRNMRRHATIGMSLVNALDAGTLNFIVFDEERTQVLAGELHGQFQEPATYELAQSMRYFVPVNLMVGLPRS